MRATHSGMVFCETLLLSGKHRSTKKNKGTKKSLSETHVTRTRTRKTLSTSRHVGLPQIAQAHENTYTGHKKSQKGQKCVGKKCRRVNRKVDTLATDPYPFHESPCKFSRETCMMGSLSKNRSIYRTQEITQD